MLTSIIVLFLLAGALGVFMASDLGTWLLSGSDRREAWKDRGKVTLARWQVDLAAREASMRDVSPSRETPRGGIVDVEV